MDEYTTNNISSFHNKQYKQKWDYYYSLQMVELFTKQSLVYLFMKRQK